MRTKRKVERSQSKAVGTLVIAAEASAQLACEGGWKNALLRAISELMCSVRLRWRLGTNEQEKDGEKGAVSPAFENGLDEKDQLQLGINECGLTSEFARAS